MNHGLTVSSPDAETREFWIRHGICCREIAERIGEELDDEVLLNFWIPDGLKDTPTDRYGLRKNLVDALDRIYAEPAPHVVDAFEQKVFGLGVEGFTVGDQELYEGWAARHGGSACVLLDTGHFNPTEDVADKLSALALFFDRLLHGGRPMPWDSDHVTLFNDDLRELAGEIVRVPGAWEKSMIGMDFFDASINRIGAWACGMRSMEKALLFQLLQPNDQLKEMQDTFQDSRKMIVLELVQVHAVWTSGDEYCRREAPPRVSFGDKVKSLRGQRSKRPRRCRRRKTLMAMVDFVKTYVRMCNDGWLRAGTSAAAGNLTRIVLSEKGRRVRSFFGEPASGTRLALPCPTWRGSFVDDGLGQVPEKRCA